MNVSSKLAEDLMPPEVPSTATWATLLVDYANGKCVLATAVIVFTTGEM